MQNVVARMQNRQASRYDPKESYSNAKGRPVYLVGSRFTPRSVRTQFLHGVILGYRWPKSHDGGIQNAYGGVSLAVNRGDEHGFVNNFDVTDHRERERAGNGNASQVSEDFQL